MKPTLLTLISVFIISNTLYSQCDFYEDYSTNLGWTQVGTDVEIVGGRLEYINGAPGSYSSGGTAVGEQKRIYKSLGTILNSNDTWMAEFEFTPIALGTDLGQPFTAHTLLAITAGTQEPFSDCPDIACTGFPVGTQDGIMLAYGTPNPLTGDVIFLIQAKDNSSEYFDLAAKVVANTLKTTYYLRVERTSATNVKLSVFSDAARTVHVANSPTNLTIPNTITGLNTVQQGNMVRADYKKELTGSIDNLCINFNRLAGIADSRKDETKLNLYPNPNSGQFVVEIENVKNNALIEIYNLIGEKIHSEVITNNEMSIDISNNSNGIYFIKVIDGENSMIQKFIKTK